jgi:hypothetical protein
VHAQRVFLRWSPPATNFTWRGEGKIFSWQVNTPLSLFLDDSACDAITGVPGGIGHEIVSLGMDDE